MLVELEYMRSLPSPMLTTLEGIVTLVRLEQL